MPASLDFEHFEQVEAAKVLLRNAGYVVIPKDRHVVVQARAVLNPSYVELARDDGYVDHVWRGLAVQLGHEIASKLCIKTDETHTDFITGKERVFRMSAAVIAPRHDLDKR